MALQRWPASGWTLADLPLYGAILLTTSSGNTGQEQARARLLCTLLPRLGHLEGVHQVVVESRGGGDRHDRRTRDRLRRSRQITAELRVDHAGKALPLLWPADWVASAYVAAYVHGEQEPWEIINSAHLIEITRVDPRWREAGGPVIRRARSPAHFRSYPQINRPPNCTPAGAAIGSVRGPLSVVFDGR